MKIKLLLGSYIDSNNAQDINCYNIAKYINKDMFEVHAFVHRNDVNLPGVKCHKVSNNRILKNVQKLLLMLLIKAHINYLPRVEKVDIFFAKYLKRDLKVVSSVEIQTVYDKSMYDIFFNRYCDRYFCISKFLNNINIQKWGKNVPVLYLGVSVGKKSFPHKKLKTIAYVGSVSERKRPFLFLELAKKIDYLQFKMIGDGPLLTEVKRKAEEEQLRNMQFTGQVSNAQVYELLSDCDLLVMTSSYEGLPKVVLEAASHGLPSIYLNEYYNIDYIIDDYNGYGVKTEEQIIKNIAMLYKDSMKYQIMSQNSIDTSEKYRWDYLISDYEKFFEECSK